MDPKMAQEVERVFNDYMKAKKRLLSFVISKHSLKCVL